MTSGGRNLGRLCTAGAGIDEARPMAGLLRKPRLMAGPRWRVVAAALRLEAVAAVDRLAARRAEWDLGLAATVRARGAEHLARRPGGGATARGGGAARGGAP